MHSIAKSVIMVIIALAATIGLTACTPNQEQQAKDIAELETRGFDSPEYYGEVNNGYWGGAGTQYSVGIGNTGCRIVLHKADDGWHYGDYEEEANESLFRAYASNVSLAHCYRDGA